MFAYCITIKGNEISEFGYNNLEQSSRKVGNKFAINKFEAVTPEYVDSTLKEHGVKWNYPLQGEVMDFASGLKKSAYVTRDINKRIACGLSHYLLWKTAISTKSPILVLEHDAIFQHDIDFDINISPLSPVG